jgi:4-hydroxy-2-oxoheptanedioate aldolase
MHAFNQRLRKKNAPLIGYSLNTYDPVFVDIVARIGVDVVWIEMEHSGMTFREMEDLCRIIDGNGMISVVRLPGVERETVLKAAESGVSMLIAPMTNTPEAVGQFVRQARYTPIGARGFYGSSRALNYGLGGTPAELRQIANDRLLLWAQIETIEALNRIDEIAGVPGIDGLFMGPGDLSAELGMPGVFDHPQVIEAVAKGPETCRRHSRLCGAVCPVEKIGYWAKRGMNLLIVSSNVNFYIRAGTAVRRLIDDQLAAVTGE